AWRYKPQPRHSAAAARAAASVRSAGRKSAAPFGDPASPSVSGTCRSRFAIAFGRPAHGHGHRREQLGGIERGSPEALTGKDVGSVRGELRKTNLRTAPVAVAFGSHGESLYGGQHEATLSATHERENLVGARPAHVARRVIAGRK